MGTDFFFSMRTEEETDRYEEFFKFANAPPPPKSTTTANCFNLLQKSVLVLPKKTVFWHFISGIKELMSTFKGRCNEWNCKIVLRAVTYWCGVVAFPRAIRDSFPVWHHEQLIPQVLFALSDHTLVPLQTKQRFASWVLCFVIPQDCCVPRNSPWSLPLEMSCCDMIPFKALQCCTFHSKERRMDFPVQSPYRQAAREIPCFLLKPRVSAPWRWRKNDAILPTGASVYTPLILIFYLIYLRGILMVSSIYFSVF